MPLDVRSVSTSTTADSTLSPTRHITSSRSTRGKSPRNLAHCPDHTGGPAARKVGEGCPPTGRLDPVEGRVLEVGVAVKQHRGAQGSSQCTYPWSRRQSNGRRQGAQVHM